MVCYDRTIFENLESEGAKNPNIEKISFKVVQIKHRRSLGGAGGGGGTAPPDQSQSILSDL